MTQLSFGNCDQCKFAQRIPTKATGNSYDHWRARDYKYFCKRFPPTPAISRGEIWGEYATVNDRDGCWEFQQK